MYVNQKLDEPVNKIKQEALEKPSAAEALSWYLKKYLLFWRQHEKEIVFYSLSLTRMLDSPSLWKMYSDWSEDYLNFLEDLFQSRLSRRRLLKPYPRLKSCILQDNGWNSSTAPCMSRTLFMKRF